MASEHVAETEFPLRDTSICGALNFTSADRALLVHRQRCAPPHADYLASDVMLLFAPLFENLCPVVERYTADARTGPTGVSR